MFETIVVPLDGSALAECVIPHVTSLAKAFGAPVLLARVLATPGAEDASRAVDALDWSLRRREGETYLRVVADRLREAGLTVDQQLLEGDAAEEIVRLGRAGPDRLILLSSHGQSGLSRWNVSGVVQKVIMRAYTSVMIVRAYRPVPAEDVPVVYPRLLVPLDGSVRAELVLPAATAIARAHDSQLLLVHVVERPKLPRRMPLTPEETALAERLIERNRDEAEQYLADLGGRMGVENREVRVIVGNQAHIALGELAAQENMDLVILSAHGYSGESPWPYGSVVTAFLAYGATPLLVIQDMPPERAVPTAAELALGTPGRR